MGAAEKRERHGERARRAAVAREHVLVDTNDRGFEAVRENHHRWPADHARYAVRLAPSRQKSPSAPKILLRHRVPSQYTGNPHGLPGHRPSHHIGSAGGFVHGNQAASRRPRCCCSTIVMAFMETHCIARPPLSCIFFAIPFQQETLFGAMPVDRPCLCIRRDSERRPPPTLTRAWAPPPRATRRAARRAPPVPRSARASTP